MPRPRNLRSKHKLSQEEKDALLKALDAQSRATRERMLNEEIRRHLKDQRQRGRNHV